MAKEEVRGFEITELRLGLPGCGPTPAANKNEKKRVFSEDEEEVKSNTTTTTASTADEDDRRYKKKKQVVGWPPVCSYRRKKRENMLVKISVDGAPFVRKLDLGLIQNGYSDLAMAIENLFGIIISSENYLPIYQDRDGDWMLLGDVPWKMFIESCGRLRIMKRSEAKGFEIHPINQSRSSSSS